jgi:hypothetical protein
MSVIIYRSTDGSAPVLTGQNGSLLTLLAACLVTGYGAKAAAGWTIPFTGTNISVFRAPSATGSPSEGNRRYLRVADDLASTYGAAVNVFDTMSDVNTGTFQFPTFVQNTGKIYLRKSITSDATARPWTLIASERAFYLVIASGSTTYGATTGFDAAFFFGDFPSNVPGDTVNTALIANPVLSTSINQEEFGRADVNVSLSGSFGRMLRAPGHGFGVGTQFILSTRTAIGNSVIGSVAYGADYPDPIRGGLILNRVDIGEAAYSGIIPTRALRGYLPGLWASENKDSPGSYYDTFDGTNFFVGRQFIILPIYYLNSQGRVYLELSDTWWD